MPQQFKINLSRKLGLAPDPGNAGGGKSPRRPYCGCENYRDDLCLLYFASIAPGTGELAALVMVPMQTRGWW